MNDADVAIAVAEAGAEVSPFCEAAGCVVTDLRGHPWGFGPTGLLVAADAETHAVLVALVRKYLV
jgi:myo-inositol-1(or 4)-monophosphatase